MKPDELKSLVDTLSKVIDARATTREFRRKNPYRQSPQKLTTYANPPLRATSRLLSGLIAAKPFATFAFPPLLCAARFFSAVYLLDANP